MRLLPYLGLGKTGDLGQAQKLSDLRKGANPSRVCLRMEEVLSAGCLGGPPTGWMLRKASSLFSNPPLKTQLEKP